MFSQREWQVLGAGLMTRLVLLLVAVPVTYSEWFLPFVTHVAAFRSLDPWTHFLADGGTVRAFPYGPLYLIFLPLTALGGLLGPRGAAFGMGLTVLVLDVLLLLTLRRIAPADRKPQVTLAYWLSPIVIYVCYWHGQLDVLPVLLLTLALALLRERRFQGAGGALGLATAAKMSMGLAIPFVWIYAIAARRLRSRAPRLIAATCLGTATLLPFLFSSGFRQMVLRTPESGKIFSLAIVYGDLTVYVTPLVLAGLVLAAWRIRRFNFDILFSLIGVAFFVVFLLTPASPGWSLWLVPFLVVHLSRSNRSAWALALVFSALFVMFHLLTSSGAGPALALSRLSIEPRTLNLLLSLYLASGGIIAFQMLQNGLSRNPFYLATRTPLTLAIAGDSGAGKDTLAEALQQLFGKAATAMISGDDYHSWDRHKPMWRALTHLNPAANNLRRFNSDVLTLRAGRSIAVAHYDHRIGRMTKPHRVDATDVIIASGLHALHSPELVHALDLGIFMAMDEDLRLYLKIRRDVLVRGYSLEAVRASLRKRESDSARYIRPQVENAHLILSLVPLDPGELADPLGNTRDIQMALRIEAGAASDLTQLQRVLIGVGGMDVLPHVPANDRVGIEVIGSPKASDIATAAEALMPEMADYLAIQPQWTAGLVGIMQLAVLDQLGQRLALRRGS